jgi:predicted small secreted protein
MRRLISLASTALVLTGCEATTRGIPTGTSTAGVAMDKGSNPAPDGGVKFTRFEDLPPDLAAHVRRLMTDPEELRKADRAQALERVPVRYAFAERPLPRGAIAAVLRDPGGEPRRALIFSESTISPRATSLARLALYRDEGELPEAAARRVLFIWDDQRVEGEGKSWNLNAVLNGGPPGLVEDLLAAPRGAKIDVSQIGPVRIVETEQ